MTEQHLRKKVDITEHVQGKLNQGQLILYLNEEEIGRINLAQANPPVVFRDGYGLITEGYKIYQIQEVGTEQDHYVEGCDLGWC
ncbi:hypothetical protein J2S00_001195 [Caldalkalibacillus uzonensis]|uniref:DUF2553 family protein n=1 Tax=Caldalkalibacillus uzonensis TaxID=353224 RepID=A0ABU0CPT5_9BACI|nr:DUF2553 family protein [Caldalkalibacillus uzonensis]MDQ0338411.1 hypothetical protein [Caldalkalibacillus uzonensis]